MKRLAIVLMVLGLALISVGITAAQPPPGGNNNRNPPPPNDNNGNNNPRPRQNGNGDGRQGNRNDGNRNNNNNNGGNGNGNDANTIETAPATPDETVANTDSSGNDVLTLASIPVVNATYFLMGGDNTVLDASEEAFTNHLPGYTEAQIAQFEEGDELFEEVFIAANWDDLGIDSDGLGPFFNATSCESCHVEDGRGRPPLFAGEEESGFLIRLARNERNLNGGTMPDPIYGGQLQDMSIDGIPPEGSVSITYTEIAGTFADGTPYSLRVPSYQIDNLPYGALASDVTFSPRVAGQMIGLGLLEAISEDTVLSFADPTDANGDGVSGRPNYVWDVFNNRVNLGRFGWKANQPHLLQQTAGAYNGDMGISTSLFNHQSCTDLQLDCMAMPTGGAPEVPDEHVLLVAFYSSSLAVPAQRNADDPLVQRGAAVFEAAQCSSCHIPQVTTGIHPTIPQLSNQTIHPFTDLLLHDMGDELADGQPDFQATGNEWRTPPLWGIGLFETINGHTFYLHDGRARNLSEAILWHGGEGATARDYFINMSAADRDALLAFLKSL